MRSSLPQSVLKKYHNMQKLKQLNEEELKRITDDRDAVSFVKSKNEKVFYYSKNTKEENSPLLDVEIALRKCERTGFFRNKE